MPLVTAASLVIAVASSALGERHLPAPNATIIHVDKNHPQASNRNPGTSDRPLATVSAAAKRALRLRASGNPVEIRIRPGVYREAVNFHGSGGGTDLAPVTIKGVGKGATISGSDVWRGWTNAPGTNIYVHDWPYRWGETPNPPEWQSDIPKVIRRREMVFVDRHHLRQVMSYQELTSTKKSFYVSEREEKIYIRPREGTNIGEATIEVAKRPHLFAANDQRNVTIRNITFKHAPTPMPGSAVYFWKSSGIRIVNSRFLWNNWQGLSIGASKNIRLDRVMANHNGVTGFGAGGSQNLLFVDTETSYNNWRGSRGYDLDNHDYAIRDHFIDFSTGQKFVHLRDAIFRNHRSIGNLTGGLWFDTDNARIVLDNVVLKDNLTHGVFVEATQGPFLLKDSLLCNNETGLLMQHSTDGTVTGNVFKGNLLGQILVAGVEEPRHVEDTETGEDLYLHAKRWTFLENTFKVFPDSFGLRTYLPPEQWELFVDTLTSNRNKWYHGGGNPRLFRIAGGRNLTFKRWKEYSEQDRLSEASAVRGECALGARGGADAVGTERTSPPLGSLLPIAGIAAIALAFFRLIS